MFLRRSNLTSNKEIASGKDRPRNDMTTNKNLPSTNGTGGRFPRYHPSSPPLIISRKAGRFVLTNISLPDNAGIAVRTTCKFHTNNSRGNFNWFRANGTFSACVPSLWRFLPAYFPLSLPFVDWVSPVTLYYLRKRDDVKASILFGMFKPGLG